MDLLIKEVKTTKRVQTNIEKFESLTLSDGKNNGQSTASTKASNLILEVDATPEPPPLLTAVSSRTTASNSKAVVAEEALSLLPQQSKARYQRKQSAIFVQQQYLNKEFAQPELADDAREILKFQPGVEDVEAVLTYIQYGIDGQHEFNIKVTGPKSSMLLRVLVTVTIPDLWPSLIANKNEASSERSRKILLSALLSVTAIELLLEQIRMLSRTHAVEKSAMLDIYLDVLAALLRGTDTVMILLEDVSRLYQKDVQRRLFWQGAVALLGGSKILATTSALSRSSHTTSEPFTWLTIGADYSRWLADNIVRAAIELQTQEILAWSNLCQLYKRGLSLGYRGKVDQLVSKDALTRDR